MTNRLLMTAVLARHGCLLTSSNGTYLIRKGSRRIRISSSHLVYARDLAVEFDQYFGEVQETSPKEVDYSTPRLHVLRSGEAFELSSFPEESGALDIYFRYYTPQEGELVFDIGAYCGVFTKRLSERVGKSGRVIAFEPDPVNSLLLQKNVKRHNLANVIVIKAAISDQDGRANLFSEGALGSFLESTSLRESNASSVGVETMTFETACARFGVPSFVKVDAEAAEIEILTAAKEFIRSKVIRFALDTNHLRDGSLTTARVEQLFRDAGYDAISNTDWPKTTWAKPAGLKQ